ncbi:threonine synthase, partial [Peptococcaceae bacterium]|nr:threonine synthase [Peptococcaceae bacterium]
EGKNVHVVAVEGNFDDCQSGVKRVFSDKDFNEELNQKSYKLSSANSINWGRLIPQVVYYFSSYLKLVRENKINFGDKVNFVVPTGNFGNILAGYYAMKMGLPVNKLICAANSNNVLTDFIKTGMYDKNREFLRTISPSMDILISSNLERLLFEVTDRNADKIDQWMAELKQSGKYEVDDDVKEKVQDIFWSEHATDEDTMKTIKEVWDKHNYLVDTHTAVAFKVYEDYKSTTGDETQTIILSTASPFKFNASVAKAVLGKEKIKGKSEFLLLEMLSDYTRWPIPASLRGLDKRKVLHTDKIAPVDMKQKVANILGV